MATPPTCLASRLISTAVHISLPSQLSTTHRGAAFENRSLKILQNCLSMSLRCVGGKSDGGIDLLGWWWLPALDSTTLTISGSNHQRRRLRVLGQCKAQRKKPSPNYVREMEGVMHRYMSLPEHSSLTQHEAPSPHDDPPSISSSQYPLVALLISESPFTKATLLRAQSSPIPFFLLHIPPISNAYETNPPIDDEQEQQNQIGTAVWNPALAGVRGLLGGQMEIRWERSLNGGGRPGLWWRGQKLESWTPDAASGEALV